MHSSKQNPQQQHCRRHNNDQESVMNIHDHELLCRRMCSLFSLNEVRLIKMGCTLAFRQKHRVFYYDNFYTIKLQTAFCIL